MSVPVVMDCGMMPCAGKSYAELSVATQCRRPSVQTLSSLSYNNALYTSRGSVFANRTASRPRCTGAIFGAGVATGRAAALVGTAGVAALVRCTPPAGWAGFVGHVPILGPVAVAVVAPVVVMAAAGR